MVTSVDSLLECLLALCRFHGAGTTAEAVCGGLPLKDGRLTPDLFERAAARAGLSSKLVYRDASDIESALLPAVVMLKGESACLLTGWDESGATAKVVYPDHNEALVEVPGKNYWPTPRARSSCAGPGSASMRGRPGSVTAFAGTGSGTRYGPTRRSTATCCWRRFSSTSLPSPCRCSR